MPLKNSLFARFSDSSIKRKLVIFTMISTLTTLLLALGAIITIDQILTKRNMVAEVTALSEVIAARSEVAVNFGDKRNSQSNLDALKNSPQYVLACIYGRNNALFASFPQKNGEHRCPDEPPADMEDFQSVTSKFIHQWTAVKRNDQEQIGYLYVRRSLASLNQRLTQFILSSATISLVVSIIGYAIIARLQRVISKPILDLSVISTKIAQDNDYQRRAEVNSKDEVGSLSQAFNSMLDTIEKAQEALKFMAFYDALTSLPNRRHFMETLGRQIESVQQGRRSLALFLIDLDGFKGVNDTIGHDAGDMVLRTVSERMPTVLRKSDMVARLGGDEFTVILTDLITPEIVRKIALQLIAAIELPIEFKGQRADVSASIGIALAPADATSMDVLLKSADAAMYRAKAGGKKTFYFYDENIDEVMKTLHRQEKDLRSLIATQSAPLRYQPVVELRHLLPIGFIVSLDNLVQQPKVPFVHNSAHKATSIQNKLLSHNAIRYVVDQSVADTMLNFIVQQLAKDISTDNTIPKDKAFKLFLSVTHAQLSDENLSHKLVQLIRQLEINGIHLKLAIDQGQYETEIDQNLKEHLVLCDNGNGLENLGAMGEANNWCLASLPQAATNTWETKAWDNLLQEASQMYTQIIGVNLNTREQLKIAESLNVVIAAGSLIAKPLLAHEIHDWLSQGKKSSFTAY